MQITINANPIPDHHYYQGIVVYRRNAIIRIKQAISNRLLPLGITHVHTCVDHKQRE